MLLRKLLYLLLHRSKPGGLVIEPIGDGASPHFKRYREEFAKDLFGYVPPKTLGRAKKLLIDKRYPAMLSFQDSILSCVHATCAELKSWYLNWQKHFTWRWSYGQVPHFRGGTRFKDAMRVLKKGNLLNNYLPEEHFFGGEKRMQTIHFFKKGRWVKASKQEISVLKRIASRYTFKNWYYLYSKDRQAIKHALAKAPLPAGIYVQSHRWHWGRKDLRIIKWDRSRKGDLGHLVLLLDYDDDRQCWYITDHDGGGLKCLDYNYPFIFIAYVEDGKSEHKKDMLRVIKLADSPAYYVVFLDNTKAHIKSWDLYLWGVQKGIWVSNDKVEVVSKKEFDRYPEDQKSKYLLEIINAYNNSHK